MNLSYTTVNRSPLYQQARQILLKRIESKEWAPGDKLPIEPVLAQQLGISVGTLRRAVETLVNDGLLLRREGIGTFVRTYKNAGYWNVFQIFKDKEGKRRGSFWKLVSFEKVKANPTIATALQVPVNEPLIHFVRHWIDRENGIETVVSIDESYLIASYFKGLNKRKLLEDFQENDSLYRFYDREFDVVILNQKCSIQYEVLEGDEAKSFKVIDPYPVLRTDRISLTFGHKPIEYRINRGFVDVTKIFFDLSSTS